MAVSVEVGGAVWNPRASSSVSAQEFVAAHRRMGELLDARDWNPWDRTQVDAELARVDAVLDRWTQAQEGGRPHTAVELDAQLDRLRRLAAEQRTQFARARAARAERYDESLCGARLVWLEKQANLVRMRVLLAAGMANRRLPDLEESIARLEQSVAQRLEEIGDPELVVDAEGWLPQERRERMYGEFRSWRLGLVDELVEQIPRLVAARARAGDQEDKATIGRKIADLTSSRDALMAIPRPRVAEMCTECPRPFDWHTTLSCGVLVLHGAGPCPAWPAWSARIRRARRVLVNSALDRNRPAISAPQPIAIIPSGLPLDEVVTRLEQIRRTHPDAQVKRGNRNRWEIWPRTQD